VRGILKIGTLAVVLAVVYVAVSGRLVIVLALSPDVAATTGLIAGALTSAAAYSAFLIRLGVA